MKSTVVPSVMFSVPDVAKDSNAATVFELQRVLAQEELESKSRQLGVATRRLWISRKEWETGSFAK